jgi:hypothetical protein
MIRSGEKFEQRRDQAPFLRRCGWPAVKYNHRLGKATYVAHLLNLDRPFRYVCLIDAKSRLHAMTLGQLAAQPASCI